MKKRTGMDWYSPESNMKRIVDACIFPVGLAVIYVIFDLILGGSVLLNLNAFLTLISHTTIQAFIGWGLVFIFSGGPDFSIAGAFVIAANVAAASVVEWGMGYIGIFFFSIAVTVILQLVSTFVRLKCKLPTWVSGLGMLMIYEAAGSVYTSSRSARGLTNITLGADQCRALGTHPIPLLFLIAGAVIMYLVFSRTKIGIDYRAVSSNARVAGYMGISRNRTEYIAAAVGGCICRDCRGADDQFQCQSGYLYRSGKRGGDRKGTGHLAAGGSHGKAAEQAGLYFAGSVFHRIFV